MKVTRKLLNPDEERVIVHKFTELSGTGEYNDNKQALSLRHFYSINSS